MVCFAGFVIIISNRCFIYFFIGKGGENFSRFLFSSVFPERSWGRGKPVGKSEGKGIFFGYADILIGQRWGKKTGTWGNHGKARHEAVGLLGKRKGQPALVQSPRRRLRLRWPVRG